MSIPTSEPIPSDDQALPPARRRRQRRMISRGGVISPSEALQQLAQLLIPSVDFFIFSLLAGVVLGLGIMFDSSALFVLAALFSPFMAPVIGLSLATVAGSMRFFFQSLGSIIVGALLVFMCGVLTGWIVRVLPYQYFIQPPYHTLFSWPDFIVTSLGAGLIALLLVRPPHARSLPASVALAYELYIPLGVAGFGLTSAQAHLWPDGLMVFLVHLAWAVLFGAVVLMICGQRPNNVIGYTLSGTLLMAGVVALIVVGGYGTAVRVQIAVPTLTPTATMSLTPIPPTPSLTVTPRPPTATMTGTHTLVPTRTPTLTVSPKPTAVYAVINAHGSSGAIIRAEASYDSPVIKTLLNGYLVEVLPQIVQKDNDIWVQVRTQDNVTGWILRPLLLTATPAPNW